MRNVALICGCLLLLTVGGSLRFYKLGAWPFFGDELATIVETESLFEGGPTPSNDQFARLPRMIPISHSLHELGYRLFGKDERGSRAMPALIGTLLLPVLFLGLVGPLGYRPALVSVLLVALWPEHVVRCQENRFYSFAFAAASIAMVLGAQAIWRRSLLWTGLAVAACVAGVLVHTILAVLLGGLAAGLALMTLRRESRTWALQSLAIVSLGMVCLALIYLLHVRPLLGNFNEGISWAHSGPRNLIGATLRLGIPTVLFALAGCFFAFSRRLPIADASGRKEQDWCWLSWTALWAVASLTLPWVLPARPGYSFALSLGAFVLAGKGVAEIGSLVSLAFPRFEAVWIALACGFGLPALASHYMDGSRGDTRAAAQFIAQHHKDGDAVFACGAQPLNYYLHGPTDALAELRWHNPADGLNDLESARQKYRRFWVVLHYHRNGRPEPMLAWLYDHGRLRFSLSRFRLDYEQNSTEVFLVDEREQTANHQARR